MITKKSSNDLTPQAESKIDSANEKPTIKQNKMVNIFELAEAKVTVPELDLSRLGNDQIAATPFTVDGEAVDLHYCSEAEIGGYTRCNGPDCILCKTGRRVEERVLIPVYLPTEGRIGVLPVSRSFRPFALLPQLINVMKADEPQVMFIMRDGAKYTVSTANLSEDSDRGELTIKLFQEEFEAGVYQLSDVYPKIENDQLAKVQEISRMMNLKGIQ
ncbi:MAG: hypothetical protein HQ517_04930 [SAR324 cluster bacterium]|nr:hypothetical protein [SAR324 cluster bacterium]